MGSENTGRKTPRVTGQRRRLSDITNIPISTSIVKPQDENQPLKDCPAHLQKDLLALKKLLEEKDELIETQKQNIAKLWINYCRKSKQNEEIIQHNAQLYKDLMQARDKLKILQHENTQMAAVHKICRSELQAKLADALEQVGQLQALAQASSNEKVSLDKRSNIPNMLTKLAESRARRTLGARETSTETTGPFTAKGGEDSVEQDSVLRSARRRRESKSYREPSLKVKLRQSESSSSPFKPDDNGRKSSVQGLQKVCEDQETNHSASCDSDVEIMEIVLPQAKSNELQENAEYQVGSSEIVASGVGASANTGTSAESMKGGKDQGEHAAPSSHRNSGVRPLRRAASSIGSYREPPLNTKMRRPE